MVAAPAQRALGDAVRTGREESQLLIGHAAVLLRARGLCRTRPDFVPAVQAALGTALCELRLFQYQCGTVERADSIGLVGVFSVPGDAYDGCLWRPKVGSGATCFWPALPSLCLRSHCAEWEGVWGGGKASGPSKINVGKLSVEMERV